MGIMAEVKCGKCGKSYAGTKSRCPYCGTRRGKRGGHGAESNSTAKLLVGIVILLLLVVAVVVLVVSGAKANKSNEVNTQDKTNAGVNAGEDISTVPGTNPAPAGTQTQTPAEETKPAKPVVTNLQILWAVDHSPREGGITMALGETQPVEASYDVEPKDADLTPVWASDDESVFTVLQSGKLTAVGTGSAYLTLTVGDKTATWQIIVYD